MSDVAPGGSGAVPASRPLSPDARYAWDGTLWTPTTISPDGVWLWDGEAWRPNPVGPQPAVGGAKARDDQASIAQARTRQSYPAEQFAQFDQRMADKVPGLDDKVYTISTVKKMGVWETAVFDGRPGIVSRKNQRYVEAFFEDHPIAARLMHMNVCAMVSVIDPVEWIMDSDEVKSRLKEEADFVSERDPEMKYFMANADGFMPSVSYKFLIDHEGEAGLQAARFARALGAFSPEQWEQVSVEVRRSAAWNDDDLRDAATPTNGAGMCIVFAATARATGSVVRCGVGQEEAPVLWDAASRATAALLARSRLPQETFASLFAPFSQVVEVSELAGDSFDLASSRW